MDDAGRHARAAAPPGTSAAKPQWWLRVDASLAGHGWNTAEGKSLWAKATARTSQFAFQSALTSSFATSASRRTGSHGLPSWLRPQLMVHALVTYW